MATDSALSPLSCTTLETLFSASVELNDLCISLSFESSDDSSGVFVVVLGVEEYVFCAVVLEVEDILRKIEPTVELVNVFDVSELADDAMSLGED